MSDALIRFRKTNLPISLRSKVVGILLGVFFFFVLAAWLVLALMHGSAFDKLERRNASDLLKRVNAFILAESADTDLLVSDWAEWDDTMLFVLGKNDAFYNDNLAGGYLSDLGMSFGIIYDAQHRPVWSQAFNSANDAMRFDALFPDGIASDSKLFEPDKFDEQISGLINTASGPAIISSAAIVWSDGSGPPGGYFMAGKLLDASRMESFSHNLLSDIEMMAVELESAAEKFKPAINELMVENKPYALMKSNGHINAFKMLRDIESRPLALLHVRSEANISTLGSHTLRVTILMLVFTALLLTLTLWFALKKIFLLPIEHLTAVLRGDSSQKTIDTVDGYLINTVQRLADAKGSISQRNDEIGELITAFDDLSASLHKATNSVCQIAHSDGLTGLANRRVIIDRLNSVIVSATQPNNIAVLYIDLDNFKDVNDKFGHEAGDKLLVEVATRIRQAVVPESVGAAANEVGSQKTIARIGGDEFVVLIVVGEKEEQADRVARRIVSNVAAPYNIEGNICFIGACVGVAMFPEDADSSDGILAKADAAMYEAKQTGKNTWRRYAARLAHE